MVEKVSFRVVLGVYLDLVSRRASKLRVRYLTAVRVLYDSQKVTALMSITDFTIYLFFFLNLRCFSDVRVEFSLSVTSPFSDLATLRRSKIAYYEVFIVGLINYIIN